MPFDVKEFIKSPSSYVKKVSIDEVFEFLELANEYYRNHSSTLIDDDSYDWLEDYAKKKKPNNPFFKLVGAPTENKVLLPEWMGSLDKVRDDPKALDSWKNKYNAPYVLTEKLDGNSGMYGITKNKELQLFTRGDGTFGRDISKYIEYFNDDYKSIDQIFELKEINKKKEYPLLVRGELILSKESWELIKDKGANARNVIAGTLNTKKPDKEIATHIRFVAYELIEPKMPFYEGLIFMKKLGFETVYSRIIEPSDITTEKLSEILIERRKHSQYDIDGIVVRDNEIHKTIKEKNPKYAFAFKTMITHESAEVIVTNVEWNVSKDGLIKPIVQFAPVTINNVKIKQASGFNGAFIEKNGIGIGSKITIIRSGDVIPHITSVITKTVAMMPDIPYEWTETHVDIVVKKDGTNEQMMLRQMVHFSKTLDIAHLGEGTLKKFYEKGIDTIPKLLSLQKADLLMVDGIKEKSAENIMVSIKKAMENTNCLQLMVASNLFGRGFGERKLNLIVSAHPEILKGAVLSSLKNIDGVGDATAKQFLENLPSFYKFLKEIGYKCVVEKKKPAPESKLKDMTIVFTGFRNKEWEKIIIERGGNMGSSISKNTSIVVAVDKTDDSVKLKKAHDLNIPIYDKDEFGDKYIKE
jgi:NAD-dependent DNA ligase